MEKHGTNRPKSGGERILGERYSGAKMLAIARRAGVACLMLHYYYKRWKTVSSGHAAENAWDSPFCRECCCNLETLETICEEEGSGVSDGEWKQE